MLPAVKLELEADLDKQLFNESLLKVRSWEDEFMFLAQRAGFKLCKKLEVLDDEPEYRGLDELLGVELPNEVAFEKRSCIREGERGRSSWRFFERFPPPLLGTLLRFKTSLRRTWHGLKTRPYIK